MAKQNDMSNESRFEIRCHEWGDDSDYHWSWSNTLQSALDCLKKFREEDTIVTPLKLFRNSC